MPPEDEFESLSASLHILELENQMLTERAEEGLLLGLAAESIHSEEDILSLLQKVLEIISIIKSIPFCVCYSIKGDGVEWVTGYISFAEDADAFQPLEFPAELINRISGCTDFLVEPVVGEQLGWDSVFEKDQFQPGWFAALPFHSRLIPDGFMVFIVEDRSQDRLSQNLPILRKVVQMVVVRMDNLTLLNELQKVNTELDQRVATRTRELQASNEKLQAEIIERNKAEAALKESESRFRLLVEMMSEGLMQVDNEDVIQFVNQKFCDIVGYSVQELIGRRASDVFMAAEDDHLKTEEKNTLQVAGPSEAYEIEVRRKDEKVCWLHISRAPIYDEKGEVIGSVGVFMDITHRKIAEQTLRKSEDRFRAVSSLTSDYAFAVRVEPDGKLVNEWVTGAIETITGYTLKELKARGGWGSLLLSEDLSIPKHQLRALLRGQERTVEYRIRTKSGDIRWMRDAARPVWDEEQGRIVTILGAVQDITTQVEAEKRLQRQLQRISALHNIDKAISASLDLEFVLNIILQQTVSTLEVDAADILLFNSTLRNLESAATIGFHNPSQGKQPIKIETSLAGQAAIERRLIDLSNLTRMTEYRDQLPSFFEEESFSSYFASPLIAKGQVKGVLEVFHRSPLEPGQDWFDFLESLSGQAAIAIDDAEMFSELQRANVDLVLAYDTTLEGWSKALELRDQETEGHTRRVTELTIQLASAMGIPEEELAQIRRGALLHDIGKMAIPDRVLQKPGPLTEEEWEVMRRHPVFAYDLLASIPYLRPALDIPYCHHEKWDGSGYPRGLKGSEIPLPARIFAIVDVWDALLFDRPYREAWVQDRAIQYLKAQAGSHFDPRVVSEFLKLIG